jgi:hypothetical protein
MAQEMERSLMPEVLNTLQLAMACFGTAAWVTIDSRDEYCIVRIDPREVTRLEID